MTNKTRLALIMIVAAVFGANAHAGSAFEEVNGVSRNCADVLKLEQNARMVARLASEDVESLKKTSQGNNVQTEALIHAERFEKQAKAHADEFANISDSVCRGN